MNLKQIRKQGSGDDTPNETFDYYDQRIRTLSHLLDKHACQIPVSNIDPKDVEANEELRFYYNLSTLLTTGSYEQNCSVTAIQLPGLVKCIIVNASDSKFEESAPMTGPGPHLRVHEIHERRIDIETLGSVPSDSDNVDFETHAADLLHVLRTFHSALHSDSTTSPYWYFLRFVVRRCHMKIAERMANGAKIWTTHPMQVLHDWAPGPGDVFPRSEFTMQHQILQATLSLYGVNPSTQHGERSRYHFAADNARAWAQTACAMYAMLEKRLFTPFFEAEGRTPRPMPRASMDVESITVVADYLDTFAVLLDLPPLRAIFTHPSFSARLAPRGASASAPPAAGPDAALDDAPRREEESEGEHVFRYLRAVVAWVAAALGVVQHEVFRSGVPVEVYHVVVPRAATLPLAPPVLHAVRDEVLAQLGDDAARGAATKWFEKREKAERRKPYVAKVHAESALLGILVDEETRRAVPELRKVFEFNGKLLNNVQSMFAQGYVSIGSTHNCCVSCWWLAQRLKSKFKLDFILTGTHGIVRPWLAPRTGLSVEDMKELDAKLLAVLRDAIVRGELPEEEQTTVKHPHHFHWLFSAFH